MQKYGHPKLERGIYNGAYNISFEAESTHSHKLCEHQGVPNRADDDGLRVFDPPEPPSEFKFKLESEVCDIGRMANALMITGRSGRELKLER
jgi:hypothetical protein